MAETMKKMEWSEETTENKRIECVVTRYNEHLNWLNYIPSEVTSIRVYNKNQNNSDFFTKGFECTYSHKIQQQTVNNVGRHNETIASYIVENYDNLPDVVMFVPGTVMMTPQRGLYISQMSKNLSQLEKFKGFYSPKFIRVGKKYNYIAAKELENGSKLVEGKYNSFNEWKESIIPDTIVKFVCYRGMMVVEKRNILKHPKEIYSKILSTLQDGDNTSNGFYAERFWAFLFKNF